MAPDHRNTRFTLAKQLLVVGSFLVCGTGVAQVSFGPRFGIGQSSSSSGQDPNFPSGNSGGYSGVGGHAGLFIGGPMKRAASFRSEFTLKARRNTYTFHQGARHGRTTVQMIILQVPAMVEFRARSGIRTIAGFGMEFPITGDAWARVSNSNTGVSGDLSSNFREGMRSMALSFLFDVGYDFKNGMGLSVRMDQGISSIFNADYGKSAEIADIMLVFEYDINASARRPKAAPRT